MRNLTLLLVCLFLLPSFVQAGSPYPEINQEIQHNQDYEKVDFSIFNRLNQDSSNELPESVRAFTKMLIVEKFFSSPCKFGDRFCSTKKFPDNIEEYKFVIVYEPSQTYEPQCKGTWLYHLRVDPAQGRKSASIAQYLISSDGNVLYGEGVSPDSWSSWECPITVVEDPVEDFISSGEKCYEPNINILRYQEDPEKGVYMFSSEGIVGNKVGQWWIYEKTDKGFFRRGSEPRENGPWIWEVKSCSCADMARKECEWGKWRKQQ